MKSVTVVHGDACVDVGGPVARLILYLAAERGLQADVNGAQSGKLTLSWSGRAMKVWMQKFYARRRARQGWDAMEEDEE